jgi:gas vesicle protein
MEIALNWANSLFLKQYEFRFVVFEKHVIMKYEKLIARIFAQGSKNNNGQVAVALVAGLAVGAVVSILFAPDRGSNVRKGIADKAKGINEGVIESISSLKNRIFGASEIEESTDKAEVPHFTHSVQKKRKSDIKDLIHEAHEQHTEQPLS